MKYDQLTQKKRELDKHRPMPAALAQNLAGWLRVELTYTSNAIEGNTLTRAETALVVEKKLTVSGKSLKEHLEAVNHAAAFDWIKSLTTLKQNALSQRHILQIHEFILKGIDDVNAGRYRNIPVRIAGSTVVLPNYRRVPDLMDDFLKWIRKTKNLHPVALAAEAHYQLATIHPFIDGNGRTARLLMNLILMMQGYPPAIIRKRDRLRYIKALEKVQLGGTKEDYLNIIVEAVDRSLDIYLETLDNKAKRLIKSTKTQTLLKIGNLAARANETTSTIRYWTKEGLLEVAEITPSGYKLYSAKMIDRIRRIKQLKAKRYTLAEIKQKIFAVEK